MDTFKKIWERFEARFQAVIGEKGLKEGQIELKERRTGTITKLPPADVVSRLTESLRTVLS